MSEDRDEPFLARWSRRKIAVREGEPVAEPASPAAMPVTLPTSTVAAEPAPAPELPPVESLNGLASEYRDFLKPEVDESVRRSALKRLFGDPHFNTMDRLDIYIDDYSQPDPIPAAMLKTLSQAKGLLLFDEEEQQQPASDVAPQQARAPAALVEEAICPDDVHGSPAVPAIGSEPVGKG